MKWYPKAAKAYLIRLANDFIADPMGGLYAEAGELLAEARHGSAYKTEEEFKNFLHKVCWWDEDALNDAVEEVTR